MAEHNGHDNTSNRGDHPGLALIENHDVSQEMAEEQITTGGPPGFEIDALLTLHPEERRNVMTAIANSLGGGNPRGDPQTSSLPPHVNTRNVVDAQTMVHPNSSFENVLQQGAVPTPRQPNVVHYASVTDGALPNQNGRTFQTQRPMGEQVMPSVQERIPNERELPPQMPMGGQYAPINSNFQGQWSKGRPQPTTSLITNEGLNGVNGGHGGYLNGSNVYGHPNGGCNGGNLNGNINKGCSYGNTNGNFNGFNGGNGNIDNGFNGGNLNTPSGVHNNVSGANGFNNAYGDANSGYNARYGMNGATHGGNGAFYRNGMASPLVTNGGMNQNVGLTNQRGYWNGNFHGEAQAPANVHAPPPTPAEKEVKELKEMLFKFMNKDGMNLQTLNFQEMAVLPQKFRMPEIKRFNGIGCPTSHLKAYTLAMRTRGATPQMMAANFPLTLEASAQEWIMTLDPSVLINWEKVSELFQARYMDNIKRGNDKKELKNFCMRDGESFTEFVRRWKNKVAQTLERPTRDEEMDMFLNNLKPFYFHKMVCGGYANFDTLMSAGLRIEECLRLGTMKDDTPASGSSYRQ